MQSITHPFRSVLYIPASNARALTKAQTLATDAIIFDLEDAVAVSEKNNARDLLISALAENYGERYKIVRINGLDTQWGKDDIAATKAADAVLLPKVNSAADIDQLALLIADTPIWAMMETPLGILNAAQIAGHPQLAGMVMGTNDLAKDLNCRFRADRMPLQSSLQMCLLAAKAHGVVAIDGVYNAFKDSEGLAIECNQGRDLGFDGKTLIHPAQLSQANAAFSPTQDEIELAQRQIAAFDEAQLNGQAVAVIDGKIVENLHIVTAKQTLSNAAMIAKMGH